MKYCSKCKKVYPDGVECECTKEERYSWESPIKMIELDCEPVCERCSSTENLTYNKGFKFITSDGEIPSRCRCAACQEKLDRENKRQESMKYLIIDSYQGENKFCDDKDDVEEFLKYYTEDSDRDSGSIDEVLILKLEPIESVKESDFKPVFKNYIAETGERSREPNTHIIFWNEEMFRVEEVIVPELEYDGGRSINW